MKNVFIFFCVLMVCSNVVALDVAPTHTMVENAIHYDHVVWDGIPISFRVPVGVERILTFPSAISLHNSNPNLTTDKVSIQNNAGFLYITAKKPFAAIRIPVVVKKTGQVVLVDLSAKQNSNDTPVAVVLQDNQPTQSDQSQKTAPQFINDVSLMRYAIQQLYAPRRLIAENNAISRTPMYTSRSIGLFNNDNVIAMPLISWRGGNLYVTAVLLKNSWHQKMMLDPRNLHGRWLAASFYPTNFVDPCGTLHDRTTIFLISDRPFNDALHDMRGYLS